MTICTHLRYFSVPGSSSIFFLNPFLDLKGLVSLRYNEWHPIILPYEWALSRLLVKFTHLITYHGSNQIVVHLTLSRLWVPIMKRQWLTPARSALSKNKGLQVQKLGRLPKESVVFPSIHVHRDVLRRAFWYKKLHRKSLSHHKGVCVGFCLFLTKDIHL